MTKPHRQKKIAAADDKKCAIAPSAISPLTRRMAAN